MHWIPGQARKAPPTEIAVTPKTKVAYFYGCGMRMMFPRAASETIAILKAVSPVRRPDNVCCGLPHLAHGLRGDFLALARRNIKLYEEADIVVSDCASCSGTLKRVASFFEGDPAWKSRAIS